ncbi:MAG: Fic family protein [Caldilineaceae bacterium]|nr:Fic family protein [Caldilineaceae bacterium]
MDSDIARLVDQYRAYDDSSDIHPLLYAVWLHHRFAQIPPFADGNGRTARVLMNWHLIKRACPLPSLTKTG